jgi:hypothetical protein
MEVAQLAIRFSPKVQRFYQRQQAKSPLMVTRKAVAHTLARARYYIMRDLMPMASPQTLQERALDQACQTVLFVALALSDKKWRLAFSDGNKRRLVTMAAGALVALGEAVAKAKTRLGMPGDVPIVSCYEAGCDGFWLHRYLLHYGVANVVVDASRIEVNRRARRAKTDRVDVEQLLRLLIRYHYGDQRVWSVVHVPSI